MVVKIMKSTGSMRSPLDYNDHKVDEGNAKVVDMVNMDDLPDPLHDTFSRYEVGNIRSKEVSFHMSVNPGPEDGLSEEQVRGVIVDLMKGLGYADQPFVIYRHNDIDREHYHVVSIRVNRDGKKIPDYLENRNCLKLLDELSVKYGFSVGNEGKSEKGKVASVDLGRFSPSAGNVLHQMEMIGRECCSYRFTSKDQFCLLMKTHGILVTDAPDRSGNFILKGMDVTGKVCTGPVDSRLLSVGLPSMCQDRIRDSLNALSVPRDAVERASMAVAVSMSGSRSENQFTSSLSAAGIDWECRRDGKGVISGATFIDKETKCVFNVSELRHVGLGTLQNVDRAGWDGKVNDDIRKEPEFAKDVMKGLSMLDSLLESMSSGNSREHDLQDDPRKERRRRR